MEKVAHRINNMLSDKITATEAGSITPITPLSHITANLGTWWIETDRNANMWLCRWAWAGVNAYIDCTDSQGSNAYTSPAVEFIGGRPPVHR